MENLVIPIEGKEIAITNPEKVLWPDLHITKLDYIKYLVSVSAHLLRYTKDRMLMMWCFPDGIDHQRIVHKAVPAHAPAWLPRWFYKDKSWILINDVATLVWVANYAAIELHVPFSLCDHVEYPTDLAFDLDPSDPDNFDLVLEVAFRLKEVLDSLSLRSVAKTSGATGIQVFVPIESKYTFVETRVITKFIAEYLREKMPDKITLERRVQNRGKKLYFDYLQLWRMRTLSAAYSVRATTSASVSAPVTWAEVTSGFHPTDFTMLNMAQRVEKHGDLFMPIASPSDRHGLDEILHFIKAKRHH
jgi:bifunctional non-homologous end joining protein LigD